MNKATTESPNVLQCNMIIADLKNLKLPFEDLNGKTQLRINNMIDLFPVSMKCHHLILNTWHIVDSVDELVDFYFSRPAYDELLKKLASLKNIKQKQRLQEALEYFHKIFGNATDKSIQ